MSHTDQCPSDWEARREGERAFEYGRSRYSNPYGDEHALRSSFDPPYCPDAAESFNRGYRSAEREAEERAEQEAAERRAAERRAYERAEEEAHWEREQYEYDMRAQYERDMAAQYEADMAAQAAAEAESRGRSDGAVPHAQ